MELTKALVGGGIAALIVAGTVLLLLLSIPTGESEVLAGWYEPIYYGVVLVASGLGGTLVAVVLMLREAITGMVGVVRPEVDSPIAVGKNREEHREP